MFSTNLFLFLLLISIPSLAQTSGEGSYYMSFDGTRIYYEVKGEGDPVVLVHGFIVDGESWKRGALYNDLLKAGFKVITFDMRGNGRSDKPHTPEAYENDAEAKDIMGLLDQLKIKQYTAIGYSRGSIITARLLELDKRVKRAVLGGMGPDFTNPEWPRRILFYRALNGEPVEELAGMVKYVQDSKLDQQALAYLQKAQPSTSVAVLKKVKIPVLVISGDHDSDNGSSQELAKLFPNATHAFVPGTHNEASRTQAFSDAIMKFLAKYK